MSQEFPATARASRRVRLTAIAVGALAVLLATTTVVTSVRWVGRPFPGFMLLDNRVIASIGLAHWPIALHPDLYQSQVVAVQGEPVDSAARVYAVVEALAVGTPVTYRVRRADRERDVVVPTQRFSARDWFLLYGAFLLNGAVFLASALVTGAIGRPSPARRAFVHWGIVCGVFLLTAMDLYGPARFFRFHVVAEPLMWAAGLHITMNFPRAHWLERWWWAPYLAAGVTAVFYEVFLYQPAAYSRILTLNMLLLGVAALTFAARAVFEYWQGGSALARQRVRIVTLGALFGYALPGIVLVSSAFRGGDVAMNLASYTPFLLALSMGYAIVVHDLFEIDAMVKRGAYYLVLTGAVGAAYVACVVLFDRALSADTVTQSAIFPIVFALAVLLLFNPLRARLQSLVDRVFFRTSYDATRVLASVGRDLVSTLRHARIAEIVRQTVETTIPNARTRVFVGAPGEHLRDADGDATVPPALSACLVERRIITTYDSAESYPDARTHEAVRADLRTLEADVAVPIEHSGTLAGVLTTGRKRSGLFYTAGDAEFLRALAHQAAVALANARSYEALVQLNAQLEERVHLRTVELEAANHDLAQAYSELKSAETQLVHTEKMASLGRLVAGVAHEINNPVSFIASNVTPLRRRLSQAADRSSPATQKALREAEEITDVMARGAERTAAIVKDLRTFSRLGEATRKPADLHEGIETSLRLLGPRLRDRITVHRDFGDLPLVECDPGALNQVFMNILANTCDAIPAEGNVWITTRLVPEGVSIAIRDDGPGIPPQVLPRIFDPFFTTKDVGQGTGLGLAISHGVVVAHGGSIAAESAPGHGTTFTIVLPLAAAAPDRAATG
jgi:signal transduction histidine kinase